MFDRILNMPLDDTSRLDWSRKCVLLWKLSVLIVLQIIRNQSKTKPILHTVFETLINSKSRYKTRKVSWCGGFFVLKMLELFTRAFFFIVYSGSLKYYKVLSLKMKKNHQKDASHLKNHLLFSVYGNGYISRKYSWYHDISSNFF